MIYDYSLLTSFLFTSLFIFIVVYSIYHSRSGSALGSKKKSEEQVISKQIAFDLKLINILLIILIGIRVFFLIVYPLELEDNSIVNSLFSIRFNFLVLQGAAIAFYIY